MYLVMYLYMLCILVVNVMSENPGPGNFIAVKTITSSYQDMYGAFSQQPYWIYETKESSIFGELLWYTIMAAIYLFWNTNMAAVTS